MKLEDQFSVEIPTSTELSVAFPEHYEKHMNYCAQVLANRIDRHGMRRVMGVEPGPWETVRCECGCGSVWDEATERALGSL